MYIEFDGYNKFYRRDVYYMAEEPMESELWCEYREDADDWLETQKTYRGDPQTQADSTSSTSSFSTSESVASILSFLQLADDEIDTLVADENFIYRLQKGNDTIELGFSGSRLGVCSIYHVADESDLYDPDDYIHKFYLKGYGSSISIDIPKII